MKGNASFRNDYAVSEVVGGMFLVLVAVIAFSIMYVSLFPPPPDTNLNTKIAGYVTEEGYIVLKHVGGSSLETYTVKMRYVDNGSLISEQTYTNDPWGIGKSVTPFVSYTVSDTDDQVLIQVISSRNGKKEIIFSGILIGKGMPIYPLNMLVSSLFTNTVDEDLLCFNYSIAPEIDAETYIYSWLLNGVPFAELIWAFDTNESTTVKDYSGNGNDGNVTGAAWTPNGIIGGAYYYDGGGDHLNMDLPEDSVFNNIYRSDFTVSVWIKSDDITEPHKTVLETGENNDNFVKIVQYESQFNFGVYVNKGKKVEAVVKTNTTLLNSIWYNLVGTWSAGTETLELFLNGISVDNSSDDGRGVFSNDAENGKMLVGGSGGYWQGYIDEFEVYPRVLSREQIYQFYLLKKDGDSSRMIIVSEETSAGDSWECIVTPNDGEQDDEVIESNILEIAEYPGG